MAYQFIHVDGYGRATGKGKKGGHNVASIVAEAERVPEACPHIEAPQPPTLLYGCSPKEAGEQARAWASQAVDARGHALRKDGNCLLAGVVSLPAEMSLRWEKYAADTLKWLKRQYGDRLLSVIEHKDEAHPHLHFYVVPRVGERFDTIHDGLRASTAANPDRGNRRLSPAEKSAGKKAARTAYVTAMRKWQDDFYARVSRRYGLARIGPGRTRMSRSEWKAQNSEREAVAAREMALEGKERELAAMQKTLSAQYAEGLSAAEEKARLLVNEGLAEAQRKLAEALVGEAQAKSAAAAALVAAQKAAEEAYQKANEWCAARDAEADVKALARLKKRLPPEVVKALEKRDRDRD